MGFLGSGLTHVMSAAAMITQEYMFRSQPMKLTTL
jgi:hypothetical protein